MAVTKDMDVVIIGSGSAALSAASEVRQVTDRFVMISDGVYGTTCVRNGCMPSKVLIRGAELSHQRRFMKAFGIPGGADGPVDTAALLREVRAMRGHFLRYVMEYTETFRPFIVEGRARFRAPSEVEADGTLYRARHVVLATGSTPIVPEGCEGMGERIITSDTLFELERLPDSLAVAGMSVLGAEMSQAFARLGVTVTALHDGTPIGGLSDPEVSAYATECLRREMDIRLKEQAAFLPLAGGGVRVEAAPPFEAGAVFIALSRKANLDGMGLEALGVIGPDMPVIDFDPETMQIRGLPIFIAGDVKLGRSILNEAVDEGRIAGYNAARETPARFRRRTRLQISHTDPAIAVIGTPYEELDQATAVIGTYTFDDQGRAKIMGEAAGMLRVYADGESGVLLGAEIFAPRGEHLAHQLAWVIDRRLTVFEALQLPFYHPSLEEGLLGVFRNVAEKVPGRRPVMTLYL